MTIQRSQDQSSRGAELRSIADAIQPAFPNAADVLRGIAREVDDATETLGEVVALADEMLRHRTSRQYGVDLLWALGERPDA